MSILAVAWRALHCLISMNQIVANSVFDFLVHFVQNVYPALTPMFVTSFTKVVEGLQKGFVTIFLLNVIIYFF